MALIIDSITYDLPLKVLNRKAESLFKFAERTQDGVLHSEILAVYINYDLQVAMSTSNVVDYAALYLKLTEPVETHTITILGATFTCYFAGISDEVAKDGTSPTFRNLSFSVIAVDPTRTP